MKAADYQPQDDDGYEEFLQGLRTRFKLVVSRTPHLFTTNATGLFAAFLQGLPKAKRQHYTCTSCRHFVERFGGLVSLDQSGNARSAMWDVEEAPGPFVESVGVMATITSQAHVTGVFLSNLVTWGEPTTPPWNHMAVVPPWAILYKPTPLLNAHQKMAERAEEKGMLFHGLQEFPRETVLKAKALLEADALYRSEKVLGVAKWLLELHNQLEDVANFRTRENILWLAAATAPPGWCHVRSTMIGTLLEDLKAGLSFEATSKRFKEKMHPLQYQRPTAAPSDGQINAAEKTIAALKAEGSLDRRFARLEDLQLLWKPKVQEKPEGAGGVFGHLRGKKESFVDLGAPAVTMTWVKFKNEVLLKAERIEVRVPSGRANFLAFVTAVNPDSPPMLQWDDQAQRNTVSHYVYVGGSSAAQWNLTALDFVECTGIAINEAHWKHLLEQHKPSTTFVLAGARDVAHEWGGGLFVEMLRSEYHGIRATLEAHIRTARIAERDTATACGLCLSPGAGGVRVRVVAEGIRTEYWIDRWD